MGDPTEQWDDVIEINLTGVFHPGGIGATLATRDTGSIIVISSGAALVNVPNLSDYVTTKRG